ncbi:UNVERIFIED_CONTAM: hypothetical protein Sangu_2150800 [Sesamum angustifolium]|uniref:Aminotransferase-like plant mobile domain-containing protein n=1 Tax=Sesamum angustifolium TaxID=2727405 RepID=A0AAW2LG39_9LAMI
MDIRAIYDPRDGTVLCQQAQHRSDDILDGDLDEVPQAKCTNGEATVTLQDVQVIWALPIDDEPVIGIYLDRTTNQWQDHYMEYSGFQLDVGVFKGSRLHVQTIISHIARVKITLDTPHQIVVQYARVVALLLVGRMMCPDSSGNLVSLLNLAKLEDIVETRNYSCGNAVLAFLYCELCNTSTKGKAAIGGVLQLSSFRVVVYRQTCEVDTNLEMHQCCKLWVDIAGPPTIYMPQDFYVP